MTGSCPRASAPHLRAAVWACVIAVQLCVQCQQEFANECRPWSATCAQSPAAANVDAPVEVRVNQAFVTRASPDGGLHALVPLLSASASLSFSAPANSNLILGRDEIAIASGQGSLEVEVGLNLGDNLFWVQIESAGKPPRTESLRIERSSELSAVVQVMRPPEPVEGGYFGDYLSASSGWLYVNSSRRGTLYQNQGTQWSYTQQAEELLPFPLDWMYEAALIDDQLALLAQPVNEPETLFIFKLDGEEWTLVAEHVIGDQGTVRMAGTDLCFITTTELIFFRSAASGWTMTQRLPVPASDIGFAERPTYFDSPGVALANGMLLIGAPRASLTTTSNGQWTIAECPAVQPDASGPAQTQGACSAEVGVVFVYARDVAGVWAQTQLVVPPHPVAGLHFGQTVTTDGHWAVVGTPSYGESPSMPEGGAVEVYRYDAGSFTWRTQLKPDTSRAYDYFGDTALIAADILLVGAPGFDESSPGTTQTETNTGAIFMWQLLDDGPRDLGKFTLDVSTPHNYPFPEHLSVADSELLVPANTAPYVQGASTLENVGLVYVMR